VSRIANAFSRRRRAGVPVFVGFVTAGDPSAGRTVEIALELEQAGVDVLELGVPFSDPVADGPVIQRSSERSLAQGTSLRDVLQVVEKIRRSSELPLVLFSYLNPLLRYGLEDLCRDARAAGVDGVLVTDLPPEEAGAWVASARSASLDTVFLAAPTSGDDRLALVSRCSTGFVYAVSRTGVTGEQKALSEEAPQLVGRLRALTGEPVALGFGISTPEAVAAAGEVADGVVVGSALVRFLEDEPHGDVGAQVRFLRRELPGG
jgi:tryptophan synthase alpha chain